MASWGLVSIVLSSSSTTTTSTPTTVSTLTSLLAQLRTPDKVGWMVAAIEFCASIQWTVCSLILSQYYAAQPKLFARGVTILSLASTSGQILSKLIGAYLLQYHWNWRRLTLGMCWIAVFGLTMSTWTSHTLHQAMTSAGSSISSIAIGKRSRTTPAASQNTSSYGVKYAISRVLGSKMFWLIGLAHVAGYLTRTSDRIIGSFLQDITSLSRKCSYSATLIYFIHSSGLIN